MNFNKLHDHNDFSVIKKLYVVFRYQLLFRIWSSYEYLAMVMKYNTEYFFMTVSEVTFFLGISVGFEPMQTCTEK